MLNFKIYKEYYLYLTKEVPSSIVLLLNKNKIDNVNGYDGINYIIKSIEDNIYDAVQPINFTDS